MEPRKIIRPDIAASALAHLMLVGLIILISEVHPFHAAPPETVAVDIVTPEQVKEEIKEQETKEAAKEKPPEPMPDLKLPKLDFADKSEAAGKQQAAPSPQASPLPQASPEPQRSQQQQTPPQPSPPKPSEANAQPQQPPPQAQPQPMPQPSPQAMPQPPMPPSMQPPPPAAPPPAYQAPQPDVTVKYGVMLGLPPELPTELLQDPPRDDGGDAKESIAAKLPAEVIAALRRHLRSCARLPAGVDPTDNVNIKLRAVFATDGTLLREPILMAAPPSAKGVALVKSAMSALQNCQPYKMLPANLYAEWKVLDLPFSPRDFGG